MIQHEIRCKLNPDKLIPTKKWRDSMKKIKEKGGNNQYTKAKKLGLPKPKISEKARKKLSNIRKNYVWTEDKKQQHSIAMKKAVLKHTDSYTKYNVCGRVKNIKYKNAVLKGKWELKVAMWLDGHNIKWSNESHSFNYEYKTKKHLYFPDFYLPFYNVFIEVKGYKVERDNYKWNSVDQPLIIINKNNIHKLNNLTINDLINEYIWVKG